uniref:Putative beta-2 microglobulin variant 3 n=1 Tax=Taeniopygia guttata TaxID=59729 RepID=B5G1N5_TAEGU|nr:putative beta-2 microglobulin variant 3 [Taeniopygia guttata]
MARSALALGLLALLALLGLGAAAESPKESLRPFTRRGGKGEHPPLFCHRLSPTQD